jgi:hypothetical protein
MTGRIVLHLSDGSEWPKKIVREEADSLDAALERRGNYARDWVLVSEEPPHTWVKYDAIIAVRHKPDSSTDKMDRVARRLA